MRKTFLILFFLVLLSPHSFARDQNFTTDQIRQQMIKTSIASYPGNCPCPYNLARNGSRCGKRSAYSRPGGSSPLCYSEDISDEMVQNYRKKHSAEK